MIQKMRDYIKSLLQPLYHPLVTTGIVPDDTRAFVKARSENAILRMRLNSLEAQVRVNARIYDEESE